MKFIAVIDQTIAISSVTKSLKKMGCTGLQMLPLTGIITGESGNNPLEALKIQGIKSVEEDRKVSL